MKVIFLQDVPRVGKKHDIKEVSDGYAINFLIPKKLVEIATPKSIKEVEIRQKEIKVESKVREDLLIKNLEEIKSKTIIIKQKTDEKGHLFKAIHPKDIIDAMSVQHHAEIEEEYIVLEKPIKQLGEFEIPVFIKGNKSSFKLIVEAL